MRHEELTDERIDQALRRQPRWQPPRHFARAVVARMPIAADVRPWMEPSRGHAIVRAVTTGVSAAGVAYVGGTASRQAIPALIMNADTVGWFLAAAGLVIAAAINGLAEEWI